MGEQSHIQWTDHTFNPWWGCTKVSPGCEHCYAETLAVTRQQLPVWGPAPRFGRKMMSESHWKLPEKWQRHAKGKGVRYRVFCASMADVFDEHPDVEEPRERLWGLIERTPLLDWQLLTKRPDNVMAMVPEAWRSGFPRNVWIGTSVEDQRRAEERIPELLQIPAVVRFLSCEPLIGPVNLAGALNDCRCGACDYCLEVAYHPTRSVHWVIAGGESGPGARPCDVTWIRWVVEECREARVPTFVKQLGARPVDRNDRFHAHETGDRQGWPTGAELEDSYQPRHQGEKTRIVLRDRKGGDPSEWPADLRVREFPEVAHV